MNFSQIARGDTLVKEITEANTPQRIVETRRLVKWVSVTPHADNQGSVLISYGGTPNQPSLTLGSVPGQYYDLNEIRVQSDFATDKVNLNFGTSFPS